eukprot:4883465-Amphidinium_carterae.1
MQQELRPITAIQDESHASIDPPNVCKDETAKVGDVMCKFAVGAAPAASAPGPAVAVRLPAEELELRV